MSRNGSGTYSLPAGNPVSAGTTITDTWANTTLSDIASALTSSLSKDGQTTPTGNLPMGGFKLTGMGSGSGSADSVTLGQVATGLMGSGTSLQYTATGTGGTARYWNAKAGEYLSAKDYGAVGDGTTDDTTALNALFTAAAALGNAYVTLSPAATYKCTSGLSINPNKVGLIGNGAIISFATATTGDMISFTQTESDGNMRNARNRAHPIQGVLFVGPGVATTAVRAVNINDSSSPNIISGITFKDCAFINFAKDVNFGSGAFCCTFENCNFTLTTGSPTTYSIEILTGVTNGGERNVFLNCMWNNRPYVLSHTNANATTFFNSCSLDYNTRTFTVTAGQVFVNGGHIEQSADTDYWFSVAGGNAIINFTAVSFNSMAAKTTYNPFYSDSTCTQGGIIIRDCMFNHTGTFTIPLIGGTGMTSVSGLMLQSSSSKMAVSSNQNVLAYGGFESANWTNEWTTGGLSVPTKSSAQSHSGSSSLAFATTSTNTTSNAYSTVSVKPGQYVLGELYYLLPAFSGTSATFFVTIDWLDKGGTSLSSIGQLSVNNTNVGSWTRLNLGLNAPAPAGAASYKVLIGIFGTASGTPTAYVDDVILTAV